MSEAKQLDLSNEDMVNESAGQKSPGSQRSGRAARKHGSHRSERTIDDKKTRRSKSRPSLPSSRITSKKTERTDEPHSQEDSTEGSAPGSPLSSDGDERERRDERIHSKHKQNHRYRAASRDSEDLPLYRNDSYSHHNPTENDSSRHSRRHRSSSVGHKRNSETTNDRYKSLSPYKLHRKALESSEGPIQSLKDEERKRLSRKGKHRSRRASAPHRQHSREKLDLSPCRPSLTKSIEGGRQERKTEGPGDYRNEKELPVKSPEQGDLRNKRRNRNSHQQPLRFKSLDSTVPAPVKEITRRGRESSSRKSAPARNRSMDFEDQKIKSRERQYRQGLRSSPIDDVLFVKNKNVGSNPHRSHSCYHDDDSTERKDRRTEADEKSHRQSASSQGRITEEAEYGATRHNHGSRDQQLFYSKQKARVPRLADASIPPGAYPPLVG